MDWNLIWHQAMTRSMCGGIADGKKKTVVFPVRVYQSGSKLRLKWQNFYGKKPGVIGEVTVWHKGECHVMTVGGKTEFTVSPEETVLSDEMNISVKAGEELEIRIYYVSRTSTGNSIAEEARIASGNQTHTAFDKVLPKTKIQEKYNMYIFVPMLSEIRVLSENEPENIVIFGDSIVQMGRWTEPLMKRMYKAYGEKYFLVNSGIGGNCLLWEEPGFFCRQFGEMGLKRFSRDVLEIPDVRVVMLSLGINDINFTDKKAKGIVTYENLTAATTKLTKELHDRGIRVAAQTISPRLRFPGYTEVCDELRLKYNEWLRSTDIFDYLADFDACVRDSEHPELYAEGLHQGDHLHPGKEGGQKMAEFVDLSKLTGEN